MSSDSFTPCGVITVTTDTGHKGPFVATIKGMILIRLPEARIIDLTHDAMVQWPAEAGFWLAKAYHYFPVGSVHLVVVDPGAKMDPDVLVAIHDGHVFLAPDNGVLAPLLTQGLVSEVFRLDLAQLDSVGIQFSSGIFHGRDLFAPLAAEIAAGRCAPAALGPVVDDIVPSWVDDPEVGNGVIDGVIITVDPFGNLITNIETRLVESFSAPVIQAAGHTMGLHATYSDAQPGEYLALINSFGVLEIARSEQSAADGLGLGRGSPVSVREAG